MNSRRLPLNMKSKPTDRAESSGSPRKRSKPHKSRLDVLIVERKLAPSRERAQALLLAGQVRVNGTRMDKPGTQIATESRIEIAGETLRYASRGGVKLEGALEDFGILPDDRVCLDIGSSTGGFTDCLLQHGARKVLAVDVTVNQLDWKLQQDKRVVMVERNARYLRAEDIGERADFVTVDVSFISVSKILPAVVPAAAPGADLLILVKPQFELERNEVGNGGIVRDSALHQKAVERVRKAALEAGLEVIGVKPSRLPGAEGNQEFFLHARARG
jgi:23S rRNA (cytidine1920-2'-O)/16S rRNA (cytidine1409-2'-O)-methyltransferase